MIGVVAIGRNEGDRLIRCLDSIPDRADAVVYVDSGSTDDSVNAARQRGAVVVSLDMSRPFTAARARNEGFAALMQAKPGLQYVQFVDGDCEIQPGWLDKAHATLEANTNLAVVCGRRRERYPDRSIYNRLCDIEWNTPVGKADACGGDAMIRVKAFEQVGGYNPTVIAGEEPEMCVRLRQQGWQIDRLDAEMTLHDADMMRFGQWWKRAIRAGHAYAEGAAMHGRGPARHWVREVRSNWAWGLMLPVISIAAAWPTWGASLILLGLYPLLGWRIARSMRRRGFDVGDSRLFALFCVIGKFPNALGQLRYHFMRLLGRRSGVIEYKGAA
ncbi:MAG: glycosyltransferase [Phycisphaerales bacterium]|nr:glycosyltransferase [Phycisphaerales bacterium]